jgi:large subunit ribosomal protein L25
MARKELSVAPRQVLGKKVKQLRQAGVLPANIYGHGLDSVAVQVSAEELEKTLRASSANEVIDLKVEGEKSARPVVVHHLQRHPVNAGLLHADFYQVSLREKMRADVPLVIVGRSEAVDTYSGVLVSSLEALHIEALPLDIPARIEVDITPLTELESALHVRDLALPSNIVLLTDPEVVVVKVAAPRVVEEEVAAAEAVEEEAAAAEAEAAPAAAEEEKREA